MKIRSIGGNELKLFLERSGLLRENMYPGIMDNRWNLPVSALEKVMVIMLTLTIHSHFTNAIKMESPFFR